MASTLVALQTVTVGAGGVSSITFSSIPQTYNDLIVKFSARGGAAGSPRFDISFNGSTALSSGIRLTGNGSATSSSGIPNSPTTGYGGTSGGNDTVSTFTNGEIYIPNYTSSNYKSYSVDNVGENNATAALAALVANLWSSTAAITSITLADGSSTLQQYSTFTLYGVYKDAAETTPAAPTIGTATAGSQAANVAFTPAGSGAPASSYVVTSSPGGLTATGASSPIQIGGLTSGTAYTFTVAGQNPGGVGPSSAASNSVTPYDGYESIATAYGSGGSTITFSSIPSTYTHLQLRCFGRSTFAATASNVQMQLNSDTSSANYAFHSLNGNGTAAGAEGYSSGTLGSITPITRVAGANATSGIFGTSIVDILDYTNTNKYKTVRVLTGADLNGSGLVYLVSGLWLNTSAISTITLTLQDSSNFASGSVFELYGIRG
jgi:hypothetical protein